MSRPRVLYLDVPFENEPGGDKNRSRFLFAALQEHLGAEVALIAREGAGDRPAWTHYQPRAWLAPLPAPFPRPSAAPAFSPADHEQFRELLRNGKYDFVFCRFTVAWELLRLVADTSPETAVVVDVDMVSSRLAGLTWAADRSLKKRWFLFEKWKLQRFERELFRQPWLFLFTNSTELAGVRDLVAPQPPPGHFELLPNIMPTVAEPPVTRQPVILFFGSLDSSANIDGFAFLLDEILPRIAEDLKRHGVTIHVVGKNPPTSFSERLRGRAGEQIKLIGPVESIARAIAESQFVLLPLRIASGTRTRILEAAAVGRAVVTTSIGAEGLDLGDTVFLGDSAEAMAAHVRRLLASPERAEAAGRALRERSTALYAAGNVAVDLAKKLEKFQQHRKGRTP